MYQHLPSPVKFREDINGLRAWAVIAVLLFHFSLIGLPGGFAGVDVFFVISGYLMTAIIVGGYEKGNFSICKFYMARARRILPALLVVIAVLLALGWLWLPTPDYQALGAQSAYGMSFLSNIYYWRSAGYFDSAAEEKWLLHTWSLAVEAQFYVLYPIFIALVWKFWKSLKAITVGVLVLFAASLVLNLIVTGWNPSGAFYLLPTRGWELAAGGLVYLIAKQGFASESVKNRGYWFGWILVVVSFFFITEHLAWPGYWAILPVLGTSLIILGQRENCKLTDNAVAQWLGDRSYSLYLWHWPLVVALYFASLQNEWSWVFGAFALSILLAHLSYKFVETPTRQYLSQAKLFKEILIIASVGTVIGLGAVSVKFISFDGRLSSDIELIASEGKNMHPRRDECHTPAKGSEGSPGCEFGKNNSVGLLLVGDSHAVSSVNPATIAANLNKLNAKLWSFSSCPTMQSIYRESRGNLCSESTDWILENIQKQNYMNVVIINSPGYFTNAKFSGLGFDKQLGNANEKSVSINWVKTVCNIKEYSQANVYLVRPYPIMEVSVPEFLSRKMLITNESADVKVSLEKYMTDNAFYWSMQDKASKQCGVKILNPLPYLCDDQYCYGSIKGRPLYYDDNHLSEYGNKFLVPMFEEVFKSSPKN